MEERHSPFWKKLLFTVLVVSFFFLLLEVGARFLFSPPGARFHQTHEKIIDVLGFPALNDIMAYDPDLFWSLKKNLRAERVAGSIRGNPVEFSVTTNRIGLRGGPVEEKRGYRILALGNSCTFGVGVEDHETWPAQLERLLRETHGVGAEVINGGVPGYSSFQGSRFLRKTGLQLEPDLVIACFGFNDCEPWGTKGDREIAKSLVTARWERILSRSRFYLGMRKLLRKSNGSVEVEETEGGDKDGSRPRLTGSEFHEAIVEMKDMCAEVGADLLLLIWPFRRQIVDRTPDYRVYQPIIVKVGKEERIPVINLVEPFIESEEPVLIDHVHANEMGCRVVAETIVEVMERARVR